jgi:probable addiction module antidote protein
METKKWDIFEELKTEEDIQSFIEASIEEAENDTDPRLLAHALGVAMRARRLLAVPQDAGRSSPSLAEA